MELNELINELDPKLIVMKKEIKDGIMYIYCDTQKQKTKCKYCGQESESVHSTTREQFQIYQFKMSTYNICRAFRIHRRQCNQN